MVRCHVLVFNSVARRFPPTNGDFICYPPGFRLSGLSAKAFAFAQNLSAGESVQMRAIIDIALRFCCSFFSEWWGSLNPISSERHSPAINNLHI